MKHNHSFLLSVLIAYSISNATAHEVEAHQSSARYLANEGVLVSDKQTKVLFDPFFHNNYGSYQLVPEAIRKAIFNAEPPYDSINAVIVSHAHGDHFDAKDTIKFLKKHPNVALVAPNQAIKLITDFLEGETLNNKIVSLELEVGDSPKLTKLDNLTIESVRIPHAGWPQRKEVMNLVHRVTLNQRTRALHMGDADSNDEHFQPHKAHWQQSTSDIAFPPYWFFLSQEGETILRERINADQSIGVHVPIKVPEPLLNSNKDYFSKPGELRFIEVEQAGSDVK